MIPRENIVTYSTPSIDYPTPSRARSDCVFWCVLGHGEMVGWGRSGAGLTCWSRDVDDEMFWRSNPFVVLFTS